MTTLSIAQSGWPAGSGSGSVTSNPAKLISPSCNALTRASVSMHPPRAMVTMPALGFIRAKASASKSLYVSSFSPQQRATQSAFGKSLRSVARDASYC